MIIDALTGKFRGHVIGNFSGGPDMSMCFLLVKANTKFDFLKLTIEKSGSSTGQIN